MGAIQRKASGKIIGSNSAGRIKPIAPPRPVVRGKSKQLSVNNWLAGDSAYKQQMDSAKLGANNYATQAAAQKGIYNTEYTRNLLNTNDQEKVSKTDQADDYASRGMSSSGLRVKAGADLRTDFAKQRSTLLGGKSEFEANQGMNSINYGAEQRVNKLKYRNDALSRRALRYKL